MASGVFEENAPETAFIIDEIQYMDKVIMDILTTFDRKDNVLALLTNTTSGAVEILEEKTLLKKI